MLTAETFTSTDEVVHMESKNAINNARDTIPLEHFESWIRFICSSDAEVHTTIQRVWDHAKFLSQAPMSSCIPLSWSSAITKSGLGCTHDLPWFQSNLSLQEASNLS